MAVAMVEGYEWVVAALVANIVVTNVWMMYSVSFARKRYQVHYPLVYAVEGENKNAKAFNCVQRGHQNTLEFQPAFLALLLVGGIQYPRVAASLGAIYTLARIQYFRGYSTGSPSARFKGGAPFQWLALLGLLSCSIGITLHRLLPAYV